jgi:hypothetical protein
MAFCLCFSLPHAFADEMAASKAASKKLVAQFDADESYDPFADYSEFDQAQEEEEDINFFRNGRFVTLGLLLGYRGFTQVLGKIANGSANYGLFLSYFFDLRFALQFSFVTGDHTFSFKAPDGVHTGGIGMQNLGIDIKYYLNTQNVTKGLAQFNPYILIGISEIYRTINSSDTSAYGKDSATGFDVGAGIEIPMMKNKMFWGAQGMYQLANFSDANTEITTQSGTVHTGIYPHGDTYTFLGILGINF